MIAIRMGGFAATLVMVAGLAAQNRAWVGASYVSEDIARMYLQEDLGFVATCFWPGAGQVQVTLPFNNAGAAILAQNDRFLVAGKLMSSGAGHLAEVRFIDNGGVPTPSVTSSVIGRDLTKLLYDGDSNLIYAVDYAARTVVVAPYLGNGSVGLWTTIADSSLCPTIGRVPQRFLELWPLTPEELEACAATAGVKLASREPYIDQTWLITESSGVWSAQVVVGNMPTVHPCWFAEPNPKVAPGELHYRIRIGGGLGAFSIVDHETQQVVFSGVHGGGFPDEPFDIPIGSLTYGRAYRVVSAAGQQVADSVFWRCEQEWKRVAGVPTGFVPGKTSMRWDYPSVGTDFLSWSLYWDSFGPRPQGNFQATIMLGAWSYQQNPTTLVGGLEILSVQYGMFPIQVGSWDNDRLDVGYAFDVNNPTLTGTRIAFQALGVGPDASLFVSDVRGVVLQ